MFFGGKKDIVPLGTETQKKVGKLLFDESVHLISSFELNQIASLTYGDLVCDEIFELLVETLCRPVHHTPMSLQKALVVSKHALIYGSEKCVNSAIPLTDAVKVLLKYNTILIERQRQGMGAMFQRIKGGGVDKGLPVREAAEQLYPLLTNTTQLRLLRHTSADPNSLVPVGSTQVAFLSDEVRHFLLKKRMDEQQRIQIKSNLVRPTGGFGGGLSTNDGASVVGAAHGLDEMMKMAKKTTEKYRDDGPSFKYTAPNIVLTAEKEAALNMLNANSALEASRADTNKSGMSSAEVDFLDFGEETNGNVAPTSLGDADLLAGGDLLGITGDVNATSSLNQQTSSDIFGTTDSGVGNLLDTNAVITDKAGSSATNLLDTSAAVSSTNVGSMNILDAHNTIFGATSITPGTNVGSMNLLDTNSTITGTGSLGSTSLLGTNSTTPGIDVGSSNLLGTNSTLTGTNGLGSTDLMGTDSIKPATSPGSINLLGNNSTMSGGSGLGSNNMSLLGTNATISTGLTSMSPGTGLTSTNLLGTTSTALGTTGLDSTNSLENNSVTTSKVGLGETNLLGTSSIAKVTGVAGLKTDDGGAKDLLGTPNKGPTVMENINAGMSSMSNMFSKVTMSKEDPTKPSIEITGNMNETLGVQAPSSTELALDSIANPAFTTSTASTGQNEDPLANLSIGGAQSLQIGLTNSGHQSLGPMSMPTKAQINLDSLAKSTTTSLSTDSLPAPVPARNLSMRDSSSEDRFAALDGLDPSNARTSILSTESNISSQSENKRNSESSRDAEMRILGFQSNTLSSPSIQKEVQVAVSSNTTDLQSTQLSALSMNNKSEAENRSLSNENTGIQNMMPSNENTGIQSVMPTESTSSNVGFQIQLPDESLYINNSGTNNSGLETKGLSAASGFGTSQFPGLGSSFREEDPVNEDEDYGFTMMGGTMGTGLEPTAPMPDAPPPPPPPPM